MTKKPKSSAYVEDEKAVLEIYDEIGPSWAGMIDSKFVAAALKILDGYSVIEVRINSVGGSAHEGIGIFNLLAAHKAPVHVHVMGLAASSASLIAMAGNRVTMHTGSLLMLHEPWVIALGDAAEMRKAAEMLEKYIQSGVEIYTEKSGAEHDEIRGWMAEETWFSADEAVEAGLADEVDGALSVAADLSDRWGFRNAPNEFSQMVAMSAKLSRESTNMKEQTKQTPTKPDSDADSVDPRAEFNAELKRFSEKFGAENGTQWFTEGKTWEEALALHCDELANKLAAEESGNVELRSRLEQVGGGEQEAVSFGSGEGGDGNKVDPKLARALPDGLARFASGLKLPTAAVAE